MNDARQCLADVITTMLLIMMMMVLIMTMKKAHITSCTKAMSDTLKALLE